MKKIKIMKELRISSYPAVAVPDLVAHSSFGENLNLVGQRAQKLHQIQIWKYEFWN